MLFQQVKCLTGRRIFMTKPLSSALLILSTMLMFYSVSDEKKPLINIQFLAEDNTASIYQSLIEQSELNELIIGLSATLFRFNSPLTIVYGAKEGPLYDPTIHSVQIPYQFIADTVQYFKDNNYLTEVGKTAEAAAIDTLLHTLLHEIGHAYIENQGIAVLGKEEDAADNFAAIIMLNYIEGGDDALISAADMFVFESATRHDYYDYGEYIDEHSFDLQRYFSSLCLVYGSASNKYPNLLNEIEKEYRRDRKSFCVEHFNVVTDNWSSYLPIPQ